VKRRRKTLARLTIALGVVLVLMAGGVFGAYRYYTSRLTRVSIRLPGAAASTVGGVAAAGAPADGHPRFRRRVGIPGSGG